MQSARNENFSQSQINEINEFIDNRKKELDENNPRKEIQQLLFTADEKWKAKAAYTLYLPAEVKKSTTKNVETAIRKIAFQDSKISLSIILNLLESLIVKVNEKKQSEFHAILQEFQKKLKNINQNEMTDLAGSLSLFVDPKKFYSKWERLYYHLDEENYSTLGLSEEIKPLCKELFVYLEGVHFKALIQKRRNEIQQYIADIRMQDLVQSPVPKGYGLILMSKNGKLNLDDLKKNSKNNQVPVLVQQVDGKCHLYGFSAKNKWEITTLDSKAVKKIFENNKNILSFPIIDTITELNNDQVLPELYEIIAQKKAHSSPISLGRNKAITIVSDLDAKETLPVLIIILTNIFEKMINDEKKSHTIFNLAFILKEIIKNNEIQNMDLGDISAYLNANKKNIIPDLTNMIDKIKLLEASVDVLDDLLELEIWLYGFYYDTYKNKDSWTAPGFTLRNNFFYGYTGITLAEVAEHYWVGVEYLRKIISACQEMAHHQSKSLATPVSEVVSVTETSPEIEEATIAAVIPVGAVNKVQPLIEAPQIEALVSVTETETSSEIEAVTVTQNAPVTEAASVIQATPVIENVLLPTKETVSMSEINTPTLFFDNNELKIWEILDRAKTGDAKEKIQSLINAIKNFELSPDQKVELTYLKDEVEKLTEDYKSNTYFKNILGKTISNYFLPRTHAKVASQIQQSVASSTSNDPKQVLLTLIDLRKETGPDSNDLLPGIERILADAWGRLHKLHQPILENVSMLQMSYVQRQMLFNSQFINQPQSPSLSTSVVAPPGNVFSKGNG